MSSRSISILSFGKTYAFIVRWPQHFGEWLCTYSRAEMRDTVVRILPDNQPHSMIMTPCSWTCELRSFSKHCESSKTIYEAICIHSSPKHRVIVVHLCQMVSKTLPHTSPREPVKLTNSSSSARDGDALPELFEESAAIFLGI